MHHKILTRQIYHTLTLAHAPPIIKELWPPGGAGDGKVPEPPETDPWTPTGGVADPRVATLREGGVTAQADGVLLRAYLQLYEGEGCVARGKGGGGNRW